MKYNSSEIANHFIWREELLADFTTDWFINQNYLQNMNWNYRKVLYKMVILSFSNSVDGHFHIENAALIGKVENELTL